jgi:hypothetical protein
VTNIDEPTPSIRTSSKQAVAAEDSWEQNYEEEVHVAKQNAKTAKKSKKAAAISIDASSAEVAVTTDDTTTTATTSTGAAKKTTTTSKSPAHITAPPDQTSKSSSSSLPPSTTKPRPRPKMVKAPAATHAEKEEAIDDALEGYVHLFYFIAN